jgi:hypothetical protein
VRREDFRLASGAGSAKNVQPSRQSGSREVARLQNWFLIAERQINLLSSPEAQPGVSSMKAFVLIVTFAAAGGAADEHTERIANFDDYQACASAGRSLYPREHWECVPANQPPQAGTNR